MWFVHLHVLKMALDSCCSWTHNKERKSKGGIFSFRSFHTSMKLPKHQSASFENRYLKLAFKWSSRLEDLNWIWTLSTIHQGYWVFCSRFQKLCKLKVSKFQKQIILSSHSPKNQRNFSHFSALASKKSWKIVQTQDESTKILIWCYLTQWNSFIALIRPLLKARAKNVKNFVGFLGNEKTRLFAFEIYWPLLVVKKGTFDENCA